MRRPAKRSSQVRAGVIATVMTVLLVFVLVNKGVPIGHHYTVDAIFSDANGVLAGSSLRPGSPVRIAGVEVGAVAGVEPGPGGTARVALRIDDAGRPLHVDATAKIRPRMFLEGNFVVEVQPGSPSAPEIPDGGTIPLAATARPVQLDQVLDALQSSTRDDLQVLVKELAISLQDGGSRGINRSLRWAPGALRGAALAADASLGQERRDLSQVVAASGRTAAALASRRTELADLVLRFDTTATALAARREELADGLRGLDALQAEAPARLRAVDAAIGPVRRFARTVRAPLREAPPVLDAALPFLREAEALVAPSRLPALVRYLRPTVRTLAQLEPRLDELFPLVATVAGCVRTNALPVLNSRLDDGKLSSGQRVWEEYLHAANGLVSSSQNFDGNGFNTRFSFGLSQTVVATGAGEQQRFALGSYQGSRPRKPPTRPPFDPRAPCEDQALPDLRAPAHQSTARVVGYVSGEDASRLAESLLAARDDAEAPGGAGR